MIEALPAEGSRTATWSRRWTAKATSRRSSMRSRCR